MLLSSDPVPLFTWYGLSAGLQVRLTCGPGWLLAFVLLTSALLSSSRGTVLDRAL